MRRVFVTVCKLQLHLEYAYNINRKYTNTDEPGVAEPTFVLCSHVLQRRVLGARGIIY